jgi:hypothetical protein
MLAAACGGGGTTAPAPAAPQPTTNAAGRPATREALADLIYGAFANNRPGDLDVLLPSNSEIAGCSENGAPTMAEHDENLTRWRASITDTIAECHEEIVWAGATRAGLWGGHPTPPPPMCSGLTGYSSLDIDIQTTKGLVTLRVNTPQQVAGGFVFSGAECGQRDGDERHLRALGRGSAEQEFAAYVNAVCACKDMQCVSDVGTEFAERNKGKKGDSSARPSKKMIELTTKMVDCTKKLMEEEMKRDAPPPDDDGADDDDGEDW